MLMSWEGVLWAVRGVPPPQGRDKEVDLDLPAGYLAQIGLAEQFTA